jgi:hypothetical protein
MIKRLLESAPGIRNIALRCFIIRMIDTPHALLCKNASTTCPSNPVPKALEDRDRTWGFSGACGWPDPHAGLDG